MCVHSPGLTCGPCADTYSNSMCLNPEDWCETCGTYLRGGGSVNERQPCPICGGK